MPAFRGEAAPIHPKFPASSKAAVLEEGMPFPIDYPRLEYTTEDDKAIEQYVRGLGTLLFPSIVHKHHLLSRIR